MRDFLKPLFGCVSSLKTQLEAALSIPLTEADQFDEPETDTSDDMGFSVAERSFGRSFEGVNGHPGYLTSNGRGSLEIGAAYDD